MHSTQVHIVTECRLALIYLAGVLAGTMCFCTSLKSHIGAKVLWATIPDRQQVPLAIESLKHKVGGITQVHCST